ncbi:MAG: PIG-L deacetylase family protein [Candidatus Dormibacteria bacterium]
MSPEEHQSPGDGGEAKAAPAAPELELFEYVPESALVVVAHPDDCDFLCASVLSAWCRQGCRATICLVTDGDAGSDDPHIPKGELSRVRLEEQRRAADHLGVAEVRCLRYPDGMLTNSLELRRDLVRLIRQVRPEALFSLDPTMRWFGRGYLNHPDHRAAADAALDAVFPSARDSRAFPELLAEEGLEPHKVRFVLMGTRDGEGDVAIPVEGADIENKLAALGEHRSQFDASDMRSGSWEAAQQGGGRAGVPLAEVYRLFDLVPNPSQRGYRRRHQEEVEEAGIRRAGVPEPPQAASQWG